MRWPISRPRWAAGAALRSGLESGLFMGGAEVPAEQAETCRRRPECSSLTCGDDRAPASGSIPIRRRSDNDEARPHRPAPEHRVRTTGTASVHGLAAAPHWRGRLGDHRRRARARRPRLWRDGHHRPRDRGSPASCAGARHLGRGQQHAEGGGAGAGHGQPSSRRSNFVFDYGAPRSRDRDGSGNRGGCPPPLRQNGTSCRGQRQPGGQLAHLLGADLFGAAHAVVEGRRDQVFSMSLSSASRLGRC